MNAQAERAATELADARPDVVATACLVAIMAQGPAYHCTAEESITSALRAEGSDAPVVSSAGVPFCPASPHWAPSGWRSRRPI